MDKLLTGYFYLAVLSFFVVLAQESRVRGKKAKFRVLLLASILWPVYWIAFVYFRYRGG